MSIHYERKLSRVSKDLVLFDSYCEIKGKELIGDITGPFFRLLFLEENGDDFYWQQYQGQVRSSYSPYAIFIPPFSIAQDVHINSNFKGKMLLGKMERPFKITKPILFNPGSFAFPYSQKELSKLLDSIESYQDISYNLHMAPLAQKAKEAINQGFSENISIGGIAEKLKVSGAKLTQVFKKSFGITPVQYRRGLRVEYAAFLLLTGGKPADVAFEVGYQDLGRFYKQFKEILHDTPKRFHLSSK